MFAVEYNLFRKQWVAKANDEVIKANTLADLFRLIDVTEGTEFSSRAKKAARKGNRIGTINYQMSYVLAHNPPWRAVGDHGFSVQGKTAKECCDKASDQTCEAMNSTVSIHFSYTTRALYQASREERVS